MEIIALFFWRRNISDPYYCSEQTLCIHEGIWRWPAGLILNESLVPQFDCDDAESQVETFTTPDSSSQSAMVQQSAYSQLWTGHRTYYSSCVCLCALVSVLLREAHLLQHTSSRHDWTQMSSGIFKKKKKNSQRPVISTWNYVTLVSWAWLMIDWSNKGVGQVHSFLLHQQCFLSGLSTAAHIMTLTHSPVRCQFRPKDRAKAGSRC